MPLIVLLLYGLPLLILALPFAIAARRSARWTMMDVPPLLYPGAVWIVLTHLDFKVKTLSNLIELPIVALVVALAVLLRVRMADRKSRVAAIGLFWLAAASAAPLVYFGVPTLAE